MVAMRLGSALARPKTMQQPLKQVSIQASIRASERATNQPTTPPPPALRVPHSEGLRGTADGPRPTDQPAMERSAARLKGGRVLASQLDRPTGLLGGYWLFSRYSPLSKTLSVGPSIGAARRSCLLPCQPACLPVSSTDPPTARMAPRQTAIAWPGDGQKCIATALGGPPEKLLWRRTAPRRRRSVHVSA